MAANCNFSDLLYRFSFANVRLLKKIEKSIGFKKIKPYFCNPKIKR